jgi:hypothetical protein
LDEPLGGGAVVELQVYPKCPQHRGEEAFAGAVKSRDPGGRNIAAPSRRAVEGLQHSPQPISVGALADKGLQLLSQDCLLLAVGRERDLGDPAVG